MGIMNKQKHLEPYRTSYPRLQPRVWNFKMLCLMNGQYSSLFIYFIKFNIYLGGLASMNKRRRREHFSSVCSANIVGAAAHTNCWKCENANKKKLLVLFAIEPMQFSTPFFMSRAGRSLKFLIFFKWMLWRDSEKYLFINLWDTRWIL